MTNKLLILAIFLLLILEGVVLLSYSSKGTIEQFLRKGVRPECSICQYLRGDLKVDASGNIIK